MTRERLRLGEEGEGLAARFLEARGYRIVARRWRGAGREIDLIAEKGDVVAFVEVKTRRAPLAPPALAVDRRKRQQLAAAARVAEARWPGRAFRFDVVGVVVQEGGARVEHLTDAFRLGD
ncbi:MAG TPA: YraN family protein [Gemmatimonadota bacterium]|nr:YraN family protein [Gemmatimonadota bacterium]